MGVPGTVGINLGMGQGRTAVFCHKARMASLAKSQSSRGPFGNVIYRECVSVCACAPRVGIQ